MYGLHIYLECFQDYPYLLGEEGEVMFMDIRTTIHVQDNFLTYNETADQDQSGASASILQ